jgi:transcription-repair coupling factor (superfamily II helicase)
MPNFGLSDLHQMRGRVGRSNKSILLFHLSAYSAMTEDARNVFKLWNNLVSWKRFNIAMKDLKFVVQEIYWVVSNLVLSTK